MALAVTNISTTLVRNTLGEIVNGIMALCTSALINQWSLHKPANYGAGNDTFTVDSATPSGYVEPIGVSSGVVGHRLGDFRGYEHLAKPPYYFPSDQAYSYKRYTTPAGNINLYTGEMPPTNTGDGFDTQFHVLDLGAGDTGTSIQLNIDGVDYGTRFEVPKPPTGTVIILDKPVGTYALKAYYWYRVAAGGTWVKDNEIEGGAVTLTVTETAADFVVTSRSISPTSAPAGLNDFTYSYALQNNTASALNLTLYWSMADKSGQVSISVAANSTVNNTIDVVFAQCTAPSEDFILRINSSTGQEIDDSRATAQIT